MRVAIEESWKNHLKNSFNDEKFKALVEFIKFEKLAGKTIYPPGSQIFNAFNLTPFEQVKVVILGQDPYHGPGQAHGLCFSVPKGVRPPPSLINILKELRADTGIPIASDSGDLSAWARQGVLLLNSSLTVRAGEPMSHARAGWTEFTDMVIRKISILKSNIVFIFWGKFAQEKQSLVDLDKHLVLKAAHPSPLSASQGFFGCRHFSKTNEYLMKYGKDPIDWAPGS